MAKPDRSVRVHQRDKIKAQLTIQEPAWTENQKKLIQLILNKDTKVVFVEGPAGTSKTFTSVFCGLSLLNDKRVSDIIYVRTVVESASKGLGYLPGQFEDKFKPFLLPLEDKLDELVGPAQSLQLQKEARITAMPINYLRGASFNAKFILADESQNFEFKELVTLITRIGQFSKLVICGDRRQSDLIGKSGFQTMFSIFDDEESRLNGVFCFRLGNEDIVRSGLTKFLIEKLEKSGFGG